MSVHFREALYRYNDPLITFTAGKLGASGETWAGNLIDDFFKEEVARDPSLSHIKITRRGQSGPDTYNPKCIDALWEVTTADDEKDHIRRFFNQGWPFTYRSHIFTYEFFDLPAGVDPRSGLRTNSR
jgi:hypothetical protein